MSSLNSSRATLAVAALAVAAASSWFVVLGGAPPGQVDAAGGAPAFYPLPLPKISAPNPPQIAKAEVSPPAPVQRRSNRPKRRRATQPRSSTPTSPAPGSFEPAAPSQPIVQDAPAPTPSSAPAPATRPVAPRSGGEFGFEGAGSGGSRGRSASPQGAEFAGL